MPTYNKKLDSIVAEIYNKKILLWHPTQERCLSKNEESQLGIFNKEIIDGSVVVTGINWMSKYNPENKLWVDIKYFD